MKIYGYNIFIEDENYLQKKVGIFEKLIRCFNSPFGGKHSDKFVEMK